MYIHLSNAVYIKKIMKSKTILLLKFAKEKQWVKNLANILLRLTILTRS